MRDETQWRSLVRKLEGEGQAIDVLANVAGVLRSGRTGNLKGEDVRLMLDVNVQGAILGANAIAAHMIAQGIKGHIINVGSIASLYATPGTTIYAASKFAVRGLVLPPPVIFAPMALRSPWWALVRSKPACWNSSGAMTMPH